MDAGIREPGKMKLLAGFVIGFTGVAIVGWMIIPGVSLITDRIGGEETSTFDPNAGREVSVVFIGSPDCSFSTAGDLIPAVRRIRGQVRRLAAEAGFSFRAIGVSVSEDPSEGVAFLSRFGRFHEVTAGGSFTNSAGLRFVYRDFPGIASTPQMLVFARTGRLDRPTEEVATTLLIRLVGAVSILRGSVDSQELHDVLERLGTERDNLP